MIHVIDMIFVQNKVTRYINEISVRNVELEWLCTARGIFLHFLCVRYLRLDLVFDELTEIQVT